jgi:hypothetical protein
MGILFVVDMNMRMRMRTENEIESRERGLSERGWIGMSRARMEW